MRTVDYNLQQWQPRLTVTMFTKLNEKGFWGSKFFYKRLPQARRDRNKLNRANFVTRGNQPWRIVKITKETVH